MEGQQVSGGQVNEMEHALSALSLGHALLRLGEVAAQGGLSDTSRDAVGATIRLLLAVPQDADHIRQHMHDQAGSIRAGENLPAQLSWLLDVVAREFEHQSGKKVPRRRSVQAGIQKDRSK